MIFSGRGSSLMYAIQSPVNTAGSIYLNHNEVHYEPILKHSDVFPTIMHIG